MLDRHRSSLLSPGCFLLLNPLLFLLFHIGCYSTKMNRTCHLRWMHEGTIYSSIYIKYCSEFTELHPLLDKTWRRNFYSRTRRFCNISHLCSVNINQILSCLVSYASNWKFIEKCGINCDIIFLLHWKNFVFFKITNIFLISYFFHKYSLNPRVCIELCYNESKSENVLNLGLPSLRGVMQKISRRKIVVVTYSIQKTKLSQLTLSKYIFVLTLNVITLKICHELLSCNENNLIFWY